jgi:hypothetical protein
MIMREGLRTNKINDKIIMNNIFANEHKYSFPYFAGWADGDGSFVTKLNLIPIEIFINYISLMKNLFIN